MLGFAPVSAHGKIVQQYKDLGFIPKVKSGHDVSKMRFCSMAFYPTTDSHPWAPAPTMSCLLKLYVTLHDMKPIEYVQHIRGVALGLIKICNHVPLLNDSLRHMLDITRSAHGKVLEAAIQECRVKYILGSGYHESPTAVAYLARMYDVPCCLIQDLRQFYSTNHTPGIYWFAGAELFVRAVNEVEK